MANAAPRRVDPSVKSTLVGGVGITGVVGYGSLAQTLPSVSAGVPSLLALDDTLDEPIRSAPAAKDVRTSEVGRTSVLPRRTQGIQPATVVEERPRFDRVRLLGEGAMGQVELARDNDIRRTVAVKRLQPEGESQSALLRFTDEVRIVGQLEHPGIVPIYDVGRDATGHVYLVMKHLQGETMEAIIDKLEAGDPEYIARYPVDHRIHLFLGILDAVRYAHARGVIHRDLKPANVMIGPYGEVTVMDWGIAKPIRRGSDNALSSAEPLDQTLLEAHDQRLLETQFGSLAGTPLYMSPEQAAGRNDELDERSDVYSLCVVLHEWLFLEHPLADKQTMSEVLAAIISTDYTRSLLTERATRTGVPVEFMWILVRGLKRKREERFQSVSDLECEITRALDGRMRVQCHVTFTKRVVHGALRWVDRNPLLFTVLFALIGIGALAGLGYGVWRIVRALI